MRNVRILDYLKTHYIDSCRISEIMNIFLYLWIPASFLVCSAVYAENYVMPKDLVQYAERNDCVQLGEFFDRSGVMNPPYVYGYLKGSAEDSGAFWCKKTKADNKPYLLLIFTRDSNKAQLTCSHQFEWWNPPGGVSVHRETSLGLSSFTKLSDPHQTGPRNQRLGHNVITS